MSELLTWTNDLATTVDAMDDEHKIIVSLMNKLFKLNQEQASKAVITKALNELADYSAKHFSDEEAYMESINYSDLAKHKLLHTQLLSKLGEHADNYINGPSEYMPNDFFQFLKFWLTTHINHIDKKYAHA